MSVHRIASRYAKSLLDLASERNELDKVRSDMDTFQSALQSRDFVLMLKSPMVHGDKKFNVVEAVFRDKMTPLTLEFIRIVIRKGREALLPEIAVAFDSQYRTLRNILSVRITSATPLESGVQDALSERIRAAGLASGEIHWETRVDPALIGGFVLELGDKRYDASVAHKLEDLRKTFRQNKTI